MYRAAVVVQLVGQSLQTSEIRNFEFCHWQHVLVLSIELKRRNNASGSTHIKQSLQSYLSQGTHHSKTDGKVMM